MPVAIAPCRSAAAVYAWEKLAWFVTRLRAVGFGMVMAVELAAVWRLSGAAVSDKADSCITASPDATCTRHEFLSP